MKQNSSDKFSVNIYESEYILNSSEDSIIAENLWREVKEKYKQANIEFHELRELEHRLLTLLLKGKYDDCS